MYSFDGQYLKISELGFRLIPNFLAFNFIFYKISNTFPSITFIQLLINLLYILLLKHLINIWTIFMIIKTKEEIQEYLKFTELQNILKLVNWDKISLSVYDKNHNCLHLNFNSFSFDIDIYGYGYFVSIGVDTKNVVLYMKFKKLCSIVDFITIILEDYDLL